jgi:putative endonuclease
VVDGFTRKYGCGLLVWYEQHELVAEAIRREKALKRWNRVWKLEMIERSNPGWVDLFPSLCGWAPDPRVKPEDDGRGSVEAFLKRLEA